ncbi:MAG TPA: hypothetical protein VFJ75_01495 [Gaiellaceae bacterium]|nr:hypothetical protein [Gaiellaceae bacterium]
MRLRLSFDRPSRRDLVVFGGYCVASAIYIAIGVSVFDFLLSFWVAAAYLLVAAWLIPTLARRVG